MAISVRCCRSTHSAACRASACACPGGNLPKSIQQRSTPFQSETLRSPLLTVRSLPRACCAGRTGPGLKLMSCLSALLAKTSVVCEDLWIQRSSGWFQTASQDRPAAAASVTCLAHRDGGGENICSVHLRGQTLLLRLLSSLKLRLPRTRLECQARALNLTGCSAPAPVPGCQPSVCAAVQLPCHHHYHQSELQS